VRSSARLLALITGGFILGSLFNLFWETRVVPNVAHEERIAVLRDDGRLITLTGSTRSTPREKFWIPTALLEVARGGVLVVSDELLINEYVINSLAQMTVEVEQYKSQLSDEEAQQLLQRVQFEGTGLLSPMLWAGENTEVLPFYVISADRDQLANGMRLLFHNAAVFLVDEILLRELRP